MDFIPTPAFELKMLEVARVFYNFPINQTVIVYGLSFERDPINVSKILFCFLNICFRRIAQHTVSAV